MRAIKLWRAEPFSRSLILERNGAPFVINKDRKCQSLQVGRGTRLIKTSMKIPLTHWKRLHFPGGYVQLIIIKDINSSPHP